MNSSILSKRWVLAALVAIPIVSSLAYWFSRKNNKSKRRLGHGRNPSFTAEHAKRQHSHSSDDTPPTQTWISLGIDQSMVIAMVGLPARGKSYLVKMIIRYLKWNGFECQEFNVGSYRREIGLASANSEFFDTSNANAQKVREEMAAAVQTMMYEWLHESDTKKRVAIFDATNTTKSRRATLCARARKEGVSLLFVESICNDEQVLKRNYELKLQNDDYKHMDAESARADFLSRVKAYEKAYETIEDEECEKQISYIKLINVGEKIITRNCHGYLPSQVAFYLQNVHIQPRKIYLSIIAESIERSMYGTDNVSGTESGLTNTGLVYAQNLADYIQHEQSTHLQGAGKEILVMTGTSNIHYETVAALHEKNYPCCYTPILNELRGGDLHGMSKQEIKEQSPEEYDKRLKDKLRYRYPGIGGESYLDVIERVRPVIIELERQRHSIVIVCHVAVLRCIFAYFIGVPLEQIPVKEFHPHRVYELLPGTLSYADRHTPSSSLFTCPFGCTCSVVDPAVILSTPGNAGYLVKKKSAAVPAPPVSPSPGTTE